MSVIVTLITGIFSGYSLNNNTDWCHWSSINVSSLIGQHQSALQQHYQITSAWNVKWDWQLLLSPSSVSHRSTSTLMNIGVTNTTISTSTISIPSSSRLPSSTTMKIINTGHRSIPSSAFFRFADLPDIGSSWGESGWVSFYFRRWPRAGHYWLLGWAKILTISILTIMGLTISIRQYQHWYRSPNIKYWFHNNKYQHFSHRYWVTGNFDVNTDNNKCKSLVNEWGQHRVDTNSKWME